MYDKALFVEAAIRSTLDNGPGIDEVIVIDEGSRDNGPKSSLPSLIHHAQAPTAKLVIPLSARMLTFPTKHLEPVEIVAL